MDIHCSLTNRRNMQVPTSTIKSQNTDPNPAPTLHTYITKTIACTQIYDTHIKTEHFKTHNNTHLRHWSPGRGFSWVGTEGCCLPTGTAGAESPHPRCLPLASGQGLSAPHRAQRQPQDPSSASSRPCELSDLRLLFYSAQIQIPSGSSHIVFWNHSNRRYLPGNRDFWEL